VPRIELQISTDSHDAKAFLKIRFKPSGEELEVTASIAHGAILVEQPEREFCRQDRVYVGNAKNGVAFLSGEFCGADFVNVRIELNGDKTLYDLKLRRPCRSL